MNLKKTLSEQKKSFFITHAKLVLALSLILSVLTPFLADAATPWYAFSAPFVAGGFLTGLEVYLFGTLAEVLFVEEGESPRRTFALLILIPLKFALLFTPIPVITLFGTRSMIPFAIGMSLIVFSGGWYAREYYRRTV